MGRAPTLVSVLLLPLLAGAGVSGSAVPDLDVFDVLPEGGDPIASATCTITQTLAEADGFAPLDTSVSAPVSASGFTCYRLWLEPEFPFSGMIRVELEDAHGQVAFLEFEVLLLTVTEETRREATPPLQLGSGMTFRVTVSGTRTLPVVGVGSWSAGVEVGHLES